MVDLNLLNWILTSLHSYGQWLQSVGVGGENKRAEVKFEMKKSKIEVVNGDNRVGRRTFNVKRKVATTW